MKNSKVLALKYRPKRFEDLVGQNEISKTIYNSIKIKKIPNAFLFHGIRGTGKTSLARIVAKSLNCKNGVENLCTDNFCESCQSVIDSNHLDVIEQDCATATGIDSVRDLIEFCRYPPSTSNFKVLILDEIQAMSKAGSQSLLKILEEPPSYVKFIFCTTEIKKILVTLLSRCTRFDLKRVKSSELFEFLKKVVSLEKKAISDEAIKLICKCSEGSVRDSLSLLDRALLSAKDNEDVSLETVQNIFSHFDKTSIINLLQYILMGNENDSIKIYRDIYNSGIEPNVFLNDFLEILYYLKNIESLKINGSNFDLNDEEFKKIKNLKLKIEPEILIIFWDFTIKFMEELKIVSNQNISVEMFIYRLVRLKGYRKNSEFEKNENIITPNKMKNENLKNIVSKDNSTVNQIKNITQQEEPKIKKEKNNEVLSINSFEDLIHTCLKKKEMMLKYELENNVNLVSFAPYKIEISFNEKLNKDFLKVLSTKLLEWTNNRWIIAISQTKGNISKKDEKILEISKENDIFVKSKDYEVIKNLIKDIELGKKND